MTQDLGAYRKAGQIPLEAAMEKINELAQLDDGFKLEPSEAKLRETSRGFRGRRITHR
jgi:hypothetical protein